MPIADLQASESPDVRSKMMPIADLQASESPDVPSEVTPVTAVYPTGYRALCLSSVHRKLARQQLLWWCWSNDPQRSFVDRTVCYWMWPSRRSWSASLFS